MKLWHLAHTITGLSFLVAIFGAVFISPYVIMSLVSTVCIFRSAERIRKRSEAEVKDVKG